MVPKDQCRHCLPDCTTTAYEETMSYAKLPRCDHTNIGSNQLCDLFNGDVNPPPWADVAVNQYRAINRTVPAYVVNNSSRLANYRRMSETYYEGQDTYNAFEEDIAILNIFFGQRYIKKYTTEIKMTSIEFLSLVGGTIGFAMGLSVISVAEIIYWSTVRLLINYTAPK